MRNLLELMTGRIKSAVYADILNYISEMQSSWEDDCARLIDLDDVAVLRLYTSSGQKELAQKLDAEFRTYLEIKFRMVGTNPSNHCHPGKGYSC